MIGLHLVPTRHDPSSVTDETADYSHLGSWVVTEKREDRVRALLAPRPHLPYLVTTSDHHRAREQRQLNGAQE